MIGTSNNQTLKSQKTHTHTHIHPKPRRLLRKFPIAYNFPNIFTYIHLYACTLSYIHIYTHICVYVYKYVHVHVYIHTHAYTFLYSLYSRLGLENVCHIMMLSASLHQSPCI